MEFEDDEQKDIYEILNLYKKFVFEENDGENNSVILEGITNLIENTRLPKKVIDYFMQNFLEYYLDFFLSIPDEKRTVQFLNEMNEKIQDPNFKTKLEKIIKIFDSYNSGDTSTCKQEMHIGNDSYLYYMIANHFMNLRNIKTR